MDIKDYKKAYDQLKTSDSMDNQIINAVEGKTSTSKRWSLSKAAAVALFCIVLSTGTVSAINYVVHMDSHVKNSVVQGETKTDGEKYLIENGFDTIYSTNKANTVSATDKGIKVELLETVADPNIMYVYFKVDYGKYKKYLDNYIDDSPNLMPDMGMDISLIDENGKSHGMTAATGNSDWHIVSKSSGTYGLEISNYNKIKVKQVIIEIHDFVQMDNTKPTEEKVIVSGNWKLKWNLRYGTKGVKKTFNRKINLGKDYNNANVVVKDIIITPISYAIDYSYNENDKAIKKMGDEALFTYHWYGRDKGPAKFTMNGKELNPKTFAMTEDGNGKKSVFFGYTGYIGGYENIDSINLPGGNVFEMK